MVFSALSIYFPRSQNFTSENKQNGFLYVLETEK